MESPPLDSMKTIALATLQVIASAALGAGMIAAAIALRIITR